MSPIGRSDRGCWMGNTRYAWLAVRKWIPKSHNLKDEWQGWGTASNRMGADHHGRKPFKGTVAQNVLQHGTGAINVDGVGWKQTIMYLLLAVAAHQHTMDINVRGQLCIKIKQITKCHYSVAGPPTSYTTAARRCWRCSRKRRLVVALKVRNTPGLFTANAQGETGNGMRMDSGSAARFFYCAKASKLDRDEGLGKYAGDKQVIAGECLDDMTVVWEYYNVQKQPPHRQTYNPYAIPMPLVTPQTAPSSTRSWVRLNWQSCKT